MTGARMTGARITGLGVALPEREVANDEIARDLQVDEAWIFERTGIRSRRFAAPDETASMLGTDAARSCLEDAGRAPDEIDLVICATITPDLRFPATACLIQHGLGATAGAYDVNAGCSGFLFALAQADSMVRSGMAEKVMVVGAEVLSRITDRSDPSTALLFGDGAGAALVEMADDASLGPFVLHSDGARPELLHVPAGERFIQMRGREVYRAAVAGMEAAAVELLQATDTSVHEIDLLLAHQANRRIVDAVAERLGLGPQRVLSNIERVGNTSAASIPVALHDARSAGRLREGDRILLAAFGAGFCWGAGLLAWAPTRSERVAAASREAALV